MGNNHYYIAADGGGSKTELCAQNIDTGQHYTHRFGSSNFKITSTNERDVILGGFRSFFKEIGIGVSQVEGLVMGMSGADAPSDYAHFMNIVSELDIPPERIYICNDSELGFYSCGMPPGLCMIAGTGSVATGVARDWQKARSGGWGSPTSDEGSGGWMGIKVLRDALRYCDGYDEYRPVFDSIRDGLGASSFDMLPKIVSQLEMPQIAGVAKILMDAADSGDEYCLGIVRQAAELAAEIAYSVYRRLEFQNEDSVDIVMAGSLYKSPSFTNTFKTTLMKMAAHNNLCFLGETSQPVMGGIALARILFGEPGHPGLATI